MAKEEIHEYLDAHYVCVAGDADAPEPAVAALIARMPQHDRTPLCLYVSAEGTPMHRPPADVRPRCSCPICSRRRTGVASAISRGGDVLEISPDHLRARGLHRALTPPGSHRPTCRRQDWPQDMPTTGEVLVFPLEIRWPDFRVRCLHTCAHRIDHDGPPWIGEKMKSRTASGICRFGLIGSAWLAVVGCGRASGPNEEVEIQTSAITLSGANLDLQVSGNSCSANGSQTYLQVKNGDSSPVKLADITMKFWVNDTTGSAVVPQVAYGGCVTNAAGTCVHPVSNVTATASKFTGCGPDAQHQANWEITVSTTDTTSVSPGFTWSGIQTAVHLASYANFSPGSSTWYSSCGSGQPFHSDAHYSVYVKGELVVTNLGITPPGCRADQSLTVQVPPAMSPRAFALVASGALNLSDRVTVKGPIANMGSSSTHIAADDKLVDVYTKPAVTVGARSVLQGRLRTGSSASVDSSASVVGGISSAFFEPPSTQTVRFDVPAGSLQDIVVDSDQTRVLAPGGYGRLLLRARARLALSTGDYYFQHFDTAPTDAFVDSVFKLNERDGAVRIFVRDPFTFRSAISSTSQPPDLCWRCWGAATYASSGRSRAHSWPRKPTSLSLLLAERSTPGGSSPKT